MNDQPESPRKVKIGDKCLYGTLTVEVVTEPDPRGRIVVRDADGYVYTPSVSKLKPLENDTLSCWWNGRVFFVSTRTSVTDTNYEHRQIGIPESQIPKLLEAIKRRPEASPLASCEGSGAG